MCRRTFAAGLEIFTVASLACAMSTSIEALNAARAVQGVGTAIMFVVSGATATIGTRVHPGTLISVGLTLVAIPPARSARRGSAQRAVGASAAPRAGR